MGISMKQTRKLIRFVFYFLFPFLVACSQVEYTSKYFSYPPESEPHKGNWSYLGKVFVWGEVEGGVCTLSDKKVEISIINDKEQTLLSDIMYFKKGCIRVSVTWDEFEVLKINLSEVGNKYVNDDYNRRLLNEGPKEIEVLSYSYNNKIGKFERL